LTAESIARHLIDHNHCICPGFLTPESLSATRADFNEIQNNGGFQRARIGHGTSREVNDQERRDETHWLDRGDSNPAQDALWLKCDELKAAFNEFLYLGLSSFEGHYSNYPVGGFYKRHLDSSVGTNHRMVSLIIYLNADWVASDGGKLRIYDKDSYTDVSPIGGTLVCFLSHESEHEVLINHEPRASFTGWFR
jgi:SM-20-related protein